MTSWWPWEAMAEMAAMVEAQRQGAERAARAQSTGGAAALLLLLAPLSCSHADEHQLTPIPKFLTSADEL